MRSKNIRGCTWLPRGVLTRRPEEKRLSTRTVHSEFGIAGLHFVSSPAFSVPTSQRRASDAGASQHTTGRVLSVRVSDSTLFPTAAIPCPSSPANSKQHQEQPALSSRGKRGNTITGMALGAVHALACAHHSIGPVTGTGTPPLYFVYTLHYA